MPDGRHIESSTSGHLPALGMLPKVAALSHKIPQLKHSLLSISTLCDNNCTATFDRNHCYIHHNGKLILLGDRDKLTTLWKIPLNGINATRTSVKPHQNPSYHNYYAAFDDNNENTDNTMAHVVTTEGVHVLNNLEQLTTKSDIINYLHMSMFSPVKSTWVKSIRKDHFITWPGVNAPDVSKHLLPTIATAKGHLDRKRKNIRSTEKVPPDKDVGDTTPVPEPKTNDVFIAFLSADTDGTVYTDLTGKFPITSRAGNKYVLVLYHYDSNAIIFRPMQNRTDAEAVRVYTNMYDFLIKQNCKPRLNIMDN